MKRYALITTTWDRDNPAAYLPSGYSVLYSEPHPDRGEPPHGTRTEWTHVVIGGEDRAGWTLDDYVLPRLASGGMHGVEIDLSHEIMKRVPDDAVLRFNAEVASWSTPEAAERRAAERTEYEERYEAHRLRCGVCGGSLHPASDCPVWGTEG